MKKRIMTALVLSAAITFILPVSWPYAAPLDDQRSWMDTSLSKMQPDPQNPGKYIPHTRVKSAIEIEYAEIWFRRIEVKAPG